MNRKIIPAFFTIFILAFVLSACTAIKSILPVKPAAATGTILFEDDFSVTPNGWGTMGRSGGKIGFDYQGLVISVNLSDFMFWSVNGDRYQDTRVEVDAVLLNGPTNDNFGVICRYQDNNNFYGFLLSHDGYYGVFKMLDGNMILSSVDGDLSYSEVIRQGGIVNHIETVCQGDTLKLIVNDVTLAEIQDDSFTDGQIGLIAGAYDFPGVEVLFDNLKVYQP